MTYVPPLAKPQDTARKHAEAAAKQPSKRAQRAVKAILAPPMFTSNTGKLRSASTPQDRANFMVQATDLLERFLRRRTADVRADSANPNLTELGGDELEALHTIATSAVLSMYGGFLSHAAPSQSVLPFSAVRFVSSAAQGINGVCQRLVNILAAEGLFEKNHILEPTKEVVAAIAARIEGQCSGSPTPPADATPADDLGAVTHVIATMVCANRAQLLQNADWDPGFTSVDPSRTVYIQGKFAPPYYENEVADQSGIDSTRARRRWAALLTLVHEIVHTLVHPRFRALTEDSQRLAFPQVGTEGFTEYIAIPVKEALARRIHDDPAFAAQVVGGSSRRYVEFASTAQVKGDDEGGKYEREVRYVQDVVEALGEHGADNILLAYFRGWIEFLGFDADAESKPFRGRKFATADLDAFLGARADGSLGRGLDADDKARAIVDQWRRGVDPVKGSSHFELAPGQKPVLINQLLRGWTGAPDERAIIAILENSTEDEWRSMLGPDGSVDGDRLVRKIHWHRDRLAALFPKKLGLTLREFKAGSRP